MSDPASKQFLRTKTYLEIFLDSVTAVVLLTLPWSSWRGTGGSWIMLQATAGSSEHLAPAPVLSSSCFSRSHAHPLDVVRGSVWGREVPESLQLPFGKSRSLVQMVSSRALPWGRKEVILWKEATALIRGSDIWMTETQRCPSQLCFSFVPGKQ